MNIWIVSTSVLISVIACGFALGSRRKVKDMSENMNALSLQIKQQAAAFEDAKATLQELKNGFYGNSKRDEPTADSTAQDPNISISSEQAETLRNTAQIMQDAAAPPEYEDPGKWDDV